eukprot:6367172-Amphidinium_carterae.1
MSPLTFGVILEIMGEADAVSLGVRLHLSELARFYQVHQKIDMRPSSHLLLWRNWQRVGPMIPRL